MMVHGLETMKAMNDATIADGCTPKPIDMTVASCQSFDLLYVEGRLVMEEIQVTASELIEHSKGRPINLKAVTLSDDFDSHWEESPLSLEKLIPWIDTET